MSYELKPVKELPKRKGRREPLYDKLISEFLSSEHKYVEISVKNKKSQTVLSALRKRVKGKNIAVHFIAGKIYLERA